MTEKAIAYIAVAVTMVSLVAVASGQSFAGGKSIEGMTRNPEVANQLRTQFILVAAILETSALYGFIIALLLIFVA